LDEHTAFEAFSLPAETYWSVAVSGWIDNWIRLKKLDPTVGTEFAYFECILEKIEGKTDVSQIPPREFRLVLDQDANLPVEGGANPDSASPQLRGEAIFGPRIPTDYFVTKGSGESDDGIPPDPYETFSYDLALQKAAIEDFNVVTYTSVLPPEAREVTLEDAKPTFHHGAVLEVIMAKIGGVRNQTVCAGIGRAWALDSARKSVGGYAAEYQYKYDDPDAVGAGEQEATKQLTSSLKHELSIRGLTQDGQMKFDVECLPIRKKYGMALAAIGFVKFVYPEAKALAR
jgi:arginine decarboxylase